MLLLVVLVIKFTILHILSYSLKIRKSFFYSNNFMNKNLERKSGIHKTLKNNIDIIKPNVNHVKK